MENIDICGENPHTVLKRIKRSVWTHKIISVLDYISGDLQKKELSASEVFAVPQVTCGTVGLKITSEKQDSKPQYIYWNPTTNSSFAGYYILYNLNKTTPTNEKVGLGTVEHFITSDTFTVTFTPIESIVRFGTLNEIPELPTKINHENTNNVFPKINDEENRVQNWRDIGTDTVITESARLILNSTIWDVNTYPFYSYIGSNADHNHKPTLNQYTDLFQLTAGQLIIGWRTKGDPLEFIHHYYIDGHDTGHIYSRHNDDNRNNGFFNFEVDTDEIKRLLNAPNWEFMIGSVYNTKHPEINDNNE